MSDPGLAPSPLRVVVGRFRPGRFVARIAGGLFWTALASLTAFIAVGTLGLVVGRALAPSAASTLTAIAGVAAIAGAALWILPRAVERAFGYRLVVTDDAIVVHGPLGRRSFPARDVRSVGEYGANATSSVADPVSSRIECVASKERGLFVEDQHGFAILATETWTSGTAHHAGGTEVEYLDDFGAAAAALRAFGSRVGCGFVAVAGRPRRAYSSHPLLRLAQRALRR